MKIVPLTVSNLVVSVPRELAEVVEPAMDLQV